MTTIKTDLDCGSTASELSEMNDPSRADTTLEIAHDCCSPAVKSSNMAVQLSPAPIVSGRCPACGHKGKPVDGATVKAMLAGSLLAVRDTPSLVCREADCPVTYFSVDGTETFMTDQL